MSFLDQLGGVLGNVLNGNLNDEETHAHYDQIAQAAPKDQLGAAIGSSLSGLDRDEMQQRMSNSAEQMTPQQRGGLLENILQGLGGGDSLGGLLQQIGVNPQVASNPQSASADDVAKVAAHAQSANPDLFHRAMSFYAEHPTLVKALGTAAIAQIARHLSQTRR